MSRFTPTPHRRATPLLTACAAVAFSGAAAFACINTFGTDLKGHKQRIDEEPPEDYVMLLTEHGSKEARAEWEKKYRELLQKSKTKPSVETRNDLAAAMMHIGKPKQALRILQDIEKKHPGRYHTAANLGTAYELNGDNHKALRWIKEGIKRNAKSHDGTEWLHVRILEAKLALQKDPQWLRSHSVLNLDFGAGDKPQLPPLLPLNNVGKLNSAEGVAMALNYQLTERLEFTKKPDALVADLLFDLGNLLALTASLEHAEAVYDVSLRYGPTQAASVKNRIAAANAIVQKAKADSNRSDKLRNGLQLAPIILLPSLIVAGYVAFKRRRAAV